MSEIAFFHYVYLPGLKYITHYKFIEFAVAGGQLGKKKNVHMVIAGSSTLSWLTRTVKIIKNFVSFPSGAAKSMHLILPIMH